MTKFWTIFKKEWIDTIRDRKTLVFMLALPTLVMPLIILGLAKYSQSIENTQRTKVIKLAIYGEEHWPQVIQLFEDAKQFQIQKDIPHEMMTKSIRGGQLDAALQIPSDFQQTLDMGGQAEIFIVFNDASRDTTLYRRLADPLEQRSKQLRASRLTQLGIDSPTVQEALITPIVPRKNGLATKREHFGEILGTILPYIFIIFAFMGAIYPAIDLGAGEKERITLETLLITPVERVQLVLGKYMVITLTGIISALLSILSMSLSLSYLLRNKENAANEIAQFLKAIGLSDLAIIGILIIPVSAIFGALLLSVSIYAKSFKEAQNYNMPLTYLIFLPALFSTIPGVELNLKTALIPILNISLATKEVLKGTLEPGYFILISCSTVAIACTALFFCTKWFQREDVLFRT